MFERSKEVCTICDGAGRVVDDRQAGDPVATCITCKGNGWVYADSKEPVSRAPVNTIHSAWKASRGVE